jgi:hypothetical protein
MVDYKEKEHDIKNLKDYLQFKKPKCICQYEKAFIFFQEVFSYYKDRIVIPFKRRRRNTQSYYEKYPDIVLKLGVILGTLEYKKCVRRYLETFFDVEENDFDTFLLKMSKIILLIDIISDKKELKKSCKDLKHIQDFYNLFWKFLLDLLNFVF